MAEAAILILAAGSSTRMRGADKLLQPVGGEVLLRRQARAALARGAPVLVALGPGQAARRAALAGLAVRIVEVAQATEGMAASIRAGVAALPQTAGAVLILPADMPELTADDLAAVLEAGAAHPGRVVRGAAEDGRPGHPVLFPARLFPALLELSGDRGARAIVQGEAAVLRPLPADHALTDLDTPEDWAAWRARRGL